MKGVQLGRLTCGAIVAFCACQLALVAVLAIEELRANAIARWACIAFASASVVGWAAIWRTERRRKVEETQVPRCPFFSSEEEFSPEACQRKAFQLLSESAEQAVWDWDVARDSRWWSDGVTRIIGRPFSENRTSFEEWAERIHPHDRTSAVAGIRSAMDCHETEWTAEYRFRRANGGYANVWDRGRISYDAAGGAVRMLGAMIDVTRQKETELEMRRLSGRILEAQEAERSRVARELHDSVNQFLSAARFRLQMAEDLSHVQDGSRRIHINKAAEFVGQALSEVRSISRNLRPSELDDLGLLAAVRSACEEFGERTGARVFLETANFPAVAAPEVELALYRIIQESLNNVEKHAGASEVRLNLSRSGHLLKLIVRDNGRGFAHDWRSGKNGLGLINIKERTAFVDGKVEIRSNLGHGTEVTVRIPVDRETSKPFLE